MDISPSVSHQQVPAATARSSLLSPPRTCAHKYSCGPDQRRRCAAVMQRYDAIVAGEEVVGELDTTSPDQAPMDDPQLVRHIVLCLCHILSMLVGIFVCTWRIFSSSHSGIYVELEFLDSALNFGQSFFAFAIFGLDYQMLVIPFVKKWRRFWYGTEQLHLPEVLSTETLHVCAQFWRFHGNQARQDLVADRRYKLRVYKQVFLGTDLVTWLVDVGLAASRLDAVHYGSQLLEGRIIKHVTSEHHFHDLPYFYAFTNDKDNRFLQHFSRRRIISHTED